MAADRYLIALETNAVAQKMSRLYRYAKHLLFICWNQHRDSDMDSELNLNTSLTEIAKRKLKNTEHQ